MWALIAMGLVAHSAQAQSLRNQLTDNPSPYLALHGQDPVAWQPWGEAALQMSREQNKPLFISSGYFSCHWCHVMQAESYQNEAVAQLLNDFFIPVKLDRELEPALDKRLMDYAQATLGHGGWPLNVFLSPEGLPLHAVLYQPQEFFQGILLRLVEAWTEQSERIRQMAINEQSAVSFADAPPRLDRSEVKALIETTMQHIMGQGDSLQGGFGDSNKFPSVPQLSFLLEQQLEYSDQVDNFLRTTLDAMAHHGLMDHLSGGFYRYTVDPSFATPHFEKMLYDNANLARLYLHAGKALNAPQYTAIARRTLDFMRSEMRGKNGALVAAFSAVDADDEEGGYYLWTQQQLAVALNERELAVFNAAWNMERPNELRAGNHIRSARPSGEVAKQLGLSDAQVGEHLRSAQAKLLQARKQRVLPTDDKYLGSWNGLALTAFADAARLLGDDEYRQQAMQIKQFITTKLWNGKNLVRAIAKGQQVGSASIEDYAYVGQGLLTYAQLSGKKSDYQLAKAVLEQGWQRFNRGNAWSYADNSLLPELDGIEVMLESASASPAAVIIDSSLRLSKLQPSLDPKQQLRNKALSALNRAQAEIMQGPFWFVSQVSAMRSEVLGK